MAPRWSLTSAAAPDWELLLQVTACWILGTPVTCLLVVWLESCLLVQSTAAEVKLQLQTTLFRREKQTDWRLVKRSQTCTLHVNDLRVKGYDSLISRDTEHLMGFKMKNGDVHLRKTGGRNSIWLDLYQNVLCSCWFNWAPLKWVTCRKLKSALLPNTEQLRVQ